MSGPNFNNQINNLENNSSENSSFGLIGVLQLNGFRKLWFGQIFSQLADKFFIVLTIYLIAQYWVGDLNQSNEALAEVASSIRLDIESKAQVITVLATGIYIANTIPAVILGAIAGVCADWWPKRKLMIASNGLRGLLVLGIPFCLLPGPTLIGISWGYWALLIITLIESILTQFFAPAEQAAIPLLVPKEKLLAANSIYQATSMGATILGFALGDPILRILEKFFLKFGLEGGEFVLLPLCYSIAAIFLSTIQLKESTSKRKKKNFWKEINEGLEVFKKRPRVRGAMMHLVLLYSLLAALYVLAISLASSIEVLGPTRFGTLLAVSGLGMTLGSATLAQKGHGFNRKTLSTIGLGMISFSLVLLGHFLGSLSLTLLLCGVLGIGAAMVAIPAQTTLHEDTPESKRGKVFGLQNNLINVSLSLPLVIAGTLVSSVGLVPVLWLLAGLTTFAILLERPWQHC